MEWVLNSKLRINEENPDKIVESLLEVRNIEDREAFLEPGINHLHDPYLLTGIEEAVDRIKEALDRNEKILIYGDYDVDGITAISLLLLMLRKLGGDVDFYIPHRIEEGYGLNKDGIIYARDNGFSLIITVDCGINAIREVDIAKELGLDIIITDHHVPDKTIPSITVINPKQDDNYPYRDLSGVGVAFKLCQALEKKTDLTQNYLFWNLDLVALGTIADVMPLTGENRVISKLGLTIMNERRRPGINAILRSLNHSGDIKSHHISFLLAPRINAIGRLHEARDGVELLTTYIAERASTLAKSLEEYNRKRRSIQDNIYREVIDLIESLNLLENDSGIVLSSREWHEGVLGIVASKIADSFHRPTILISEYEDLCKGSGRSIPNLDIMKVMEECCDYLEDFGGHPQACGISIKKENIESFSEIFNDLICKKMGSAKYIKSLSVDCLLPVEFLSRELIDKLEFLSPFGLGNPIPKFIESGLRVKGYPKIVGKNHLKFKVSKNNKIFTSIAFSLGQKLDLLIDNPRIKIVYTPIIDKWSKELTLKVYDIKKDF